MDPWTIMAAMTAARSLADAGKEKRQLQLASATQRYSPWTGLQANPVQYADPLGNAIQGAGAAMSMEQGNKQAAADAETRAIMQDYYKAKTAQMLGGQGQGKPTALRPMAFDDANEDGPWGGGGPNPWSGRGGWR
jgi:hypothetical protein